MAEQEGADGCPGPAPNYLLGSAPECAIRVTEDPYVSGRHARMWSDGTGAVYIEDLCSTNGTFVQRDEQRIKVFPLRVRVFPGDVVWLGARTAIPMDPERAIGGTDG